MFKENLNKTLPQVVSISFSYMRSQSFSTTVPSTSTRVEKWLLPPFQLVSSQITGWITATQQQWSQTASIHQFGPVMLQFGPEKYTNAGSFYRGQQNSSH